MKKKITLLFPSLLLMGTLFIAGCSPDKRDRPCPHGSSTSLTPSSSTEQSLLPSPMKVLKTPSLMLMEN